MIFHGVHLFLSVRDRGISMCGHHIAGPDWLRGASHLNAPATCSGFRNPRPGHPTAAAREDSASSVSAETKPISPESQAFECP